MNLFARMRDTKLNGKTLHRMTVDGVLISLKGKEKRTMNVNPTRKLGIYFVSLETYCSGLSITKF